MSPAVGTALDYYATPAGFTALGAHSARARDLPKDLGALCGVVQGLLVHPFLVQLYGLAPDASRQGELELRGVEQMLDRVLALEATPLSKKRAPSLRLLGNCRHFSVLLCALLRAHGVPARARCGFATYFEPSRFVDHWVCEVWDAERGAWHAVDAQLDAVQREACKIDFDPLDVPRDRFLPAGQAWALCRSGRANPKDFGILDLRGLWFVRGNLVRDLAALARRELLPWDGWGLMADPHESDADELPLLDRAAALSLAGDEKHAERLALQASEPGLRVPRSVVSFNLGGAEVTLPAGVANESGTLEELAAAISAWAEAEPRIAAIALVGSHARGEARPDSDVDLVVLGDAVDALLNDTRWMHRFGAPTRHTLERWGAVTSLRVWYASGLEVEFGFAAPSWAATPVDEGTRRVVAGGFRVLFDRNAILSGLSQSDA